jgi:hypothetical protein
MSLQGRRMSFQNDKSQAKTKRKEKRRDKLYLTKSKPDAIPLLWLVVCKSRPNRHAAVNESGLDGTIIRRSLLIYSPFPGPKGLRPVSVQLINSDTTRPRR